MPVVGLIAGGACVPAPPAVRLTAFSLTEVPGYGLGESPRRTCGGPVARGFDLWVSDWSITDIAGAPAGQSEIRSALDGCAVIERFAGGMSRSISFFDPSRGQWTKNFDGRYRADSVVLMAPPNPGIGRERDGYRAKNGLIGASRRSMGSIHRFGFVGSCLVPTSRSRRDRRRPAGNYEAVKNLRWTRDR